MSSRSGVPSEFSDPILDVFMAFEFKFDSGTIRVWNGLRDLTIDGNTYSPAGNVISISEVVEDAEISAKGVSFVLSSLDPTLLSYALAETYENRAVNVFIGTIVGATITAYKVFKGKMGVMTITEDGGLASLLLTAENELVILDRASVRMWTPEDQKGLTSGDLGLDFINSLQEARVPWGG